MQRLEAEKALLLEEKRIEEERLQNKVNQYEKGTAARLEAEIELRDKMQEIGHEIVQNEKEISELSIEQKKKEEEIKAEIEENAFNAAASFSSLIGELGNESLKIQKAQMLVQVGIDTAGAISSLMKMSEGNPLNLLTGGAAGIAQFAAGILRIGASVAKIGGILGSSPPLPTPPPPPSNGSGGNDFTQQGQKDNRVYVLETDITKAQTRVTNLVDVGEVF
jgi:hypothetical protein